MLSKFPWRKIRVASFIAQKRWPLTLFDSHILCRILSKLPWIIFFPISTNSLLTTYNWDTGRKQSVLIQLPNKHFIDSTHHCFSYIGWYSGYLGWSDEWGIADISGKDSRNLRQNVYIRQSGAVFSWLETGLNSDLKVKWFNLAIRQSGLMF